MKSSRMLQTIIQLRCNATSSWVARCATGSRRPRPRRAAWCWRRSRRSGAEDTTTGPLYHHFESKLGLYAFVREDVERRVLDRLEGALAVGAEPADALVVAFDYAARARFVRMLSEAHPDGRPDPVAALLTERLADAPEPLGAMLAAAWRAALAASADGASDEAVRAAISRLRQRAGS